MSFLTPDTLSWKTAAYWAYLSILRKPATQKPYYRYGLRGVSKWLIKDMGVWVATAHDTSGDAAGGRYHGRWDCPGKYESGGW